MKALVNLLIALSLSFNTVSQNNYYVSPSGSNANDGSLAKPWLTIQYGLDELISGDVLNIMSGTYNEKLQVPESGITLRKAPGASVVIDAQGLTSQVSIIEIYDVKDVTIEGLELRNNVMLDAQGIVIENNCQNITIKDCKIHDIHFSGNANDPVTANTNAQGIIVYGSDGANAITGLKIIGNEVYDCRLGYSEGIAVNGNVDGFEVTGNVVHDLTNIGMDFIGFEGTSSIPANDQARNGFISGNTVYNCISSYATSAGIYVDGARNLIIEGNTTYHNGYGIEVGCENVGRSTENVKVRSNVIYDNEIAGVAMGGYDYPTGSGKVVNSTIQNNTCYFNDFAKDGNGEMLLSYTENCRIENNIFYVSNENNALFQDGFPMNLVFDFNVYFADDTSAGINFDYAGSTSGNLASFQLSEGQDLNSNVADPMFIKASITDPDFHIPNNSPCKDAGGPFFSPEIGELDMDREERVNNLIDVGADEYHPFTYLTEIMEDIELEFYPNPANDFVILKAESGWYNFINISGSIVKTGSIKAANQRINIEDLAEGVYLIEVNSKRVKLVGKMIKN